jgi:hypothetical protein
MAAPAVTTERGGPAGVWSRRLFFKRFPIRRQSIVSSGRCRGGGREVECPGRTVQIAELVRVAPATSMTGRVPSWASGVTWGFWPDDGVIGVMQSVVAVGEGVGSESSGRVAGAFFGVGE